MEDILVFQHDPAEELGIFVPVLEEHRLSCATVRLFDGEIPAEGWETVKALMILGGPISVRDEERYPFLKWEKAIIRAGIKERLPILGICLGAQLIAAAAGAEVYSGNVQEIGWYPIAITAEGQMDSILGYLPEKPTVFQCHSDGFDLPKGAQRLASSLHYDNQAFRIGKNVYGLQFHLEVTPKMIEQWLECHWKALAQSPYISPEKIRADTRSYAQESRYYGERFLGEYIRRLLISKEQKEERHPAKV